MQNKLIHRIAGATADQRDAADAKRTKVLFGNEMRRQEACFGRVEEGAAPTGMRLPIRTALLVAG